MVTIWQLRHAASATRESLTDFQSNYLMMSRSRNEGFIYGEIEEHKGKVVAKYQEVVEKFGIRQERGAPN